MVYFIRFELKILLAIGIMLGTILSPLQQVFADEVQIDPKQSDPKQSDPKQSDPKQSDPKQSDPKRVQIKMGEYLFYASGCQTCHTADNGKFLAGGRGFKIKNQGTVYASNITPDPETGIGRYTDDEFVSALRDGVGYKGRSLNPVMPYSAYRLMDRDQILAIKAYLDQQPAVVNKVIKGTVTVPAGNQNNNTNDSFEEDPQKSAKWNRGKFLVEGPGHCASCHSSTDGVKGKTPDYSGSIVNGWVAYNISSDGDTGIGSWSDKDLQQYLSKGYVEGHGAAVGPMAKLINDGLSHLSQEDIRAMVVYLRSLPPQEKGEAPANIPVEELQNTEPSHSHGSHLFAALCASCHLDNGAGRQGEYESLWGSKTATLTQGTNLIKVILEGSELKDSKLGSFSMPGFKDGYSDQDIADIANYVIAHFGNRNGHVTVEQVKKERALLNMK
ncbi:Cytochrome c [Commensalibacter communis]|uniref:Mono- and diheme variants (CccA) n=1 Tax=Commensalibacter communis TaxID=2972786 RepID=A0A9W4TN44_9PROT|nr:c-type cytochrome [Commensalibacter communis]CAI3925104.1 Cytochrome c [Commensalibacter communis]CAI3935708.1 Cytochrome c [Commensalibacter communis]